MMRGGSRLNTETETRCGSARDKLTLQALLSHVHSCPDFLRLAAPTYLALNIGKQTGFESRDGFNFLFFSFIFCFLDPNI